MSWFRFSKSVWMSGTVRGPVSAKLVNDELRVAYLTPGRVDDAITMAQLEWVSWE